MKILSVIKEGEMFKAAYGVVEMYCYGWGYTREQAETNAKDNFDRTGRPGSEDKGYVSAYRNHSAYR